MSTQTILTVITIVIIVSAVAILLSMQKNEGTFSKIITVGPIWTSDVWSCTSNKDFLVYGALRGLENTQISISIPDLGTQSLYALDNGKMQTFTIGVQADQTAIITRTGLVTGWLTLQTMSNANATCTQIP
jgi:ABC-type antimicrobial peptide transport system permease subunit